MSAGRTDTGPSTAAAPEAQIHESILETGLDFGAKRIELRAGWKSVFPEVSMALEGNGFRANAWLTPANARLLAARLIECAAITEAHAAKRQEQESA